MKFKTMPYRKLEIKVREMTIGTMLLGIISALREQNDENLEVRVMWIDDCEISVLKGIDEVLNCGWNTEVKVQMLSCSLMTNNIKNQDFIKIVARVIEEEE